MKVKIDDLECTAATQVRKKLDRAVINQYTDDLKHGAVFPPIVAWAENGSERKIVSDGHHRIRAHVNAGLDEIEVDVRVGGMHKALLHALGANDTHGLRRNRADKRNAVELALKDPEISQLTQREIGAICGVVHQTVANIRDEILLRENKPENDPHDETPGPAKPEDERESRPPPTQNEIERDELREACKMIRAFPYEGTDATKLGLSKDDLADLEYVSAWTGHAVIACRHAPDD